eukprot:15342232-Ditylum_brightwellii.AAC.1
MPDARGCRIYEVNFEPNVIEVWLKNTKLPTFIWKHSGHISDLAEEVSPEFKFGDDASNIKEKITWKANQQNVASGSGITCSKKFQQLTTALAN